MRMWRLIRARWLGKGEVGAVVAFAVAAGLALVPGVVVAILQHQGRLRVWFEEQVEVEMKQLQWGS